MGKLTKNYIYNLGYQLFAMLVPIVTAPYLARVLGPNQLGTYGYVNSSANIVYTIAMLGTYAYGNRQIAYTRNSPEKLNQTFWEVTIARAVLGAIGTILFFAFALYNQSFFPFFLLYYPYVLANFIDCTWLYVGLEDMKSAVVKNFVCRLLNVIGIFLFVRGPEDLWIYFTLIAGTTFLTMAFIYFKIGKIVSKPVFVFENVFKHIKESAKLFLPQAASLFYLQVDKLMIQWITHQSSQLSFYEQAEKLINLPLSIITVLGTVVMPRIANEYVHNHKDAIQKLLIRAGKAGLFMACPMMLGIVSIAQQLVPWYLGREFLPVGSLMMILSPVVITNTMANIPGAQYFTATDQISILTKAYVSACALNIVMNLLLIPIWGCYGAAVATVLSSIVSAGIQMCYLVRQIDMHLLWKAGIKYFFCSLLMGFAIYIITRDMPFRMYTTFFQILMGAAVYGLAMLITREPLLGEVFARVKGIVNPEKKQR